MWYRTVRRYAILSKIFLFYLLPNELKMIFIKYSRSIEVSKQFILIHLFFNKTRNNEPNIYFDISRKHDYIYLQYKI